MMAKIRGGSRSGGSSLLKYGLVCLVTILLVAVVALRAGLVYPEKESYDEGLPNSVIEAKILSSHLNGEQTI
jgi:hypothetical protein